MFVYVGRNSIFRNTHFENCVIPVLVERKVHWLINKYSSLRIAVFTKMIIVNNDKRGTKMMRVACTTVENRMPS